MFSVTIEAERRIFQLLSGLENPGLTGGHYFEVNIYRNTTSFLANDINEST